jgi:hypothetical protein
LGWLGQGEGLAIHWFWRVRALRLHGRDNGRAAKFEKTGQYRHKARHLSIRQRHEISVQHDPALGVKFHFLRA